MRILVISFYYEPDLSAGSFRAAAFVKALKGQLTNSDSITVVTTAPNRYSSYKIDARETEQRDNITIKRIRTPVHQSGFIDQSRSFFIYMIKAFMYTRKEKYDIVFATSSRLFSAFLGAIIAKRRKIPLYLDIRDIFTDTMLSVFKNSKLRSLIPVLTMVERYTMLSATKINLVSEGFVPYFKKKFGDDLLYSFYPNGIDAEFMNFSPNNSSNKNRSSKKIFTCTGNIGEGQGLEKVVPQIAKKYGDIEFRIVGDGGRKKALQECTAYLDNVKLIEPVNRTELIKYYENSDFLFLQLNDYEAFKKVLPSKIFEYGATYKPIIAGVDGYAMEFLKRYIPDSLIYKPCDFDDFCRKYDLFAGSVDIEKRKAFIHKFSRQMIMKEMAEDFLETIKAH